MNRLLPSIFLLIFLIATSCDDQLDINEDPLAATQVDANLLFPEVLVNFSNIRESELDARIGSIVDYYEPVNGLQLLGDYQQGLRSNTFLMGNVWSNIYTNVLKNVTLLEQTAQLAEPGTQNNILAQGKLVKVLGYWQATMLWGEVPYTEAVDFVTALPAFDSQETILRGLVGEIDEALALIDDSSAKIERGDLVYNGDMDLWVRFANSLKLKILMQIANVDLGSVSSQIAEVVNQPLIEDNAQNAQLRYLDAPGNYNPFWSILNNFDNADNNWYAAGETCFDLLQELDDPRLSAYYMEGPSDSLDVITPGEFWPPAESGEYPNSGMQSYISLATIRPDRPDTYLVASETQLLKAEAILRGIASGDAQAAFERGIRASMDEYDGTTRAISSSAKDAYIESLGELSAQSEDDALTLIREQLYLANFQRLPDGWAEWRRTKVPNIDPPINSQVDGVVRRFFYPPDEVGANPNAPDNIPVDTPMWYEG
jgi:hypothetical protein